MVIPENINLGYACLNTELRKKGIFMSRTCRLATIKKKGIEYAKQLALKNLNDIMTILEWNVKNNISLMRLSSEIFPFAAHEEYGYSLDFADSLLIKIGNYAKIHNLRLTMHPAQFCVLSNKNLKIIKNTVADLNLHATILDKMGLDKQSIMVIHGGGTYGNKKKALETLKENLKNLTPKIRNRIVLENCEMSYTVEDLLPISKELLIPIVIDFHHDSINKGNFSIEQYFKDVFWVWDQRKIKPKFHISNSISGVLETDSKTKRRKHSNYIHIVHPQILIITKKIDLMVEAKMKEQAVIKLKNLINYRD